MGGEGKIGEWARYSYTYMFRMGVDIMKALKRQWERERETLSLREWLLLGKKGMLSFISQRDQCLRRSNKWATEKICQPVRTQQVCAQQEWLPLPSNWPVSYGERCQVCSEVKQRETISPVWLPVVLSFFSFTVLISHTPLWSVLASWKIFNQTRECVPSPPALSFLHLSSDGCCGLQIFNPSPPPP